MTSESPLGVAAQAKPTPNLGRQWGEHWSHVAEMGLVCGDFLVCTGGLLYMEKLLTSHGDNSLDLWGIHITANANRLADLQLCLYAAVTCGWLAWSTVPSVAPLGMGSVPIYHRVWGKVRVVMGQEDQTLANRILGAAAVGLSRLLVGVNLVGGSPPIAVICSCVVTGVLAAVRLTVPVTTKIA